MDKKTKIWLIALSAGTAVLVGLSIVYRNELKKAMVLGLDRFKSFTSALTNLAEREYNLWNRSGKIKEGDPRTMERLRDYWRKGGNLYWSDEKMTKEAWSAVFVSWLMKMAGAGNYFKYSPSHSVYIRDAIKNKKEGNNNPIKGYKPQEVKVDKGDIVCYPRQSGVGYDTTTSYKSHCDIVTEVKNDNAVSIGGNVSNSVSKTLVPLTNDGKIDLSRDKKGYFVVIKNEEK